MAILTTTNQGLNFTGGTTFIQTGTSNIMSMETGGNIGISVTSPNAKLDVDGVISTRTGTNSAYSIGVLEISDGGTPSQIKITTAISFGGTTNAHSVKISGFQYGSANTVDLQISWHVYNNSFYNRAITSSGGWAPTVTLAVENGYVVIHLSSPGYWPKMYVESLYNAYGSSAHAQGWSWADAAISGDSGKPVQTVSYKANFGNSFLMTSTGNVGIGVSNPVFKLDVAGAIQTTGSLKITTANPGIIFKETDITDKNWDIQVNNGNLKFYEVNDARTVFNEHVTFGAGGNVGIGFTSPQAAPLASTKLSVNGNTYVGGTLGVGTTDPATVVDITKVTPSVTTFYPYLQLSQRGTVANSKTGISFRNTQYDWDMGKIATERQGSGNSFDMVFYTADTGTDGEGLRIDHAGNIGIGTSTPNAKLDVQGTQGQLFSVTDDLSGDIFSVADISGVPIMNVNSDGTSYFNGDVGIGINNPSYKLDVWGNGIALGSAAFAKYDSSNDLFLVGDWDGAGADMAIYDGNSSEVVRVADGKVGIGTDNPSSKLSIRNNGTQLSLQRADATGTEWKFYSWTSGLNIFPVAASEIYIGRDGATTNLQLHNGILKVLGTGDSYFTGDVGIGVTSPSAKLHVNIPGSGTVIKATGIGATIEIQSGTAGNATLYQKPNQTGDQEAEFRMTGGSAYGWSWKDDNGSVASRITYMKLSQGNSSLSVKGDVIAYGSPSDKRYKENIKPIESALDKAVKLQGVTFDWKESDSILNIKEDIGFIAQDVQKVVPELVRENKDGKLSLRYQGITPILLEAIKELKAEIDLLKSKPCNCNNCNCNI